ncbi:MFS transporter [Candidatus Pacearchaeota archaeon]|nr:MFS transporter [Candidatus Pacearchaeota archaeon]
MKLFEKQELKLLWPFYLDSLLSPMLFFAPAFMIVYLLGLNLNLFQIGIVMAIVPLAAVIFEIPTGAVADLYGRKFSVLLGYFLEAIIVLLLFFIKSYYGIFLLFGLMGFAATFSSGAKEAWIVDLVKNHKSTVHNFFMKSRSLDAFGLIVSGILGAFIVKNFGISIIWIFAFFSFSVSILILLFSKENYKKKSVKISESYKNLRKQAKTSVKYGLKHHVIFYLLISGFIITFAVAFAEILGFIPFLKSLNFPDYAFGYFWSGIWAVTMISPFFSKFILKLGRERNLLIAFTLINSLVLAMIFFASNYILAIIIILLFYFFVGLKFPVYKTYFHKFIPSKLRATIGSMDGMISAFAAIIALPLGGYLIDLIGVRYVLVIAALLGIPTIIAYLLIREK